MKQKLGIIQAIMENQNLLVLDEPFNALDEKSVKLFRELLIEYKKQEKLIILASCVIVSVIEIAFDVVGTPCHKLVLKVSSPCL